MGGLCGCSRNNRASEQNTEKQKDDATTSMLADDGNALNVGGMKDDVTSYETLNTSNKHKQVKRMRKSKISGMDDVGREHNKSDDIDNGYDSGDDNDDGRNDERDIINNQTPNNEPLYLSSKSETLVVKNGGFENTNGEYRWFLHAKQWCFFTETGTNYGIRDNIKVSKVYEQLEALQSSNASFKWPNDIKRCWIISDMDSTHIYYAAPMQFSDKIPANFGWISVHGSKPVPILTQNKVHDSQGPDDDEDSLTFSNSSVSSLLGRNPSSRVSRIGTVAEEDASNIQESPRSGNDNDDGIDSNDNDGNESDNDDDDESDVSQMSE